MGDALNKSVAFTGEMGSEEGESSIISTRSNVLILLTNEEKEAMPLNNHQETMDQLIAKLEGLNFGDLRQVLEWLCVFEQSCLEDVNVDKDKIIDIFSKNGFNPNLHTTSEIPKEGSIEKAKILIDINLDMLRHVGIVSRTINVDTNNWIHNSKYRARMY